MESVPDSFVAHNELSGEGAGLYSGSCSHINIHDNFVYNSTQGIVIVGGSRMMFNNGA